MYLAYIICVPALFHPANHSVCASVSDTHCKAKRAKITSTLTSTLQIVESF